MMGFYNVIFYYLFIQIMILIIKIINKKIRLKNLESFFIFSKKFIKIKILQQK